MVVLFQFELLFYNSYICIYNCYAGFGNSSENAVRLHVRTWQFRHTSRTRGDTNERERSKSKNKENQCSKS